MHCNLPNLNLRHRKSSIKSRQKRAASLKLKSDADFLQNRQLILTLALALAPFYNAIAQEGRFIFSPRKVESLLGRSLSSKAFSHCW